MVAIICTYHRPTMLQRCLRALNAQTVPLDKLIVVDNGADADTGRLMAESFPQATHLVMSENLGPAGGFAVGLKAAFEAGYEHLWLFNDDATPAPGALALSLEARSLLGARPGVTAHAPEDPTGRGLRETKWFTFNGALIDREVAAIVGYPREDFFMCWEEHDYCFRLNERGIPIISIPGGHVDFGSAGTIEGATAPWRGYYQTRNELVSALEARSVRRALRWLVRTSKFSAATILSGDEKLSRLRFRLLGTWDALRRRMGRTVEPGLTGGS